MNTMSYPEKNDATEFFIHFGNWRVIRCYDGYSQKTIVWDEEYKDRYCLQQFTGLLNKDGKKIYEGDFVSCEYAISPPSFEVIGVVEFNEQYGYFGIRTEYDPTRCLSMPSFTRTIENKQVLLVEVIGNIFENPELLPL